MDNYKIYVADPATDQEIDRRIEWLDEKPTPGVPVIWIENQECLGAQTYSALESARQRVRRQYMGGAFNLHPSTFILHP